MGFIPLLVFADLCRLVRSQADAVGLCSRLFSSQSGQQGKLGNQFLGWSAGACALEASSLFLFLHSQVGMTRYGQSLSDRICCNERISI